MQDGVQPFIRHSSLLHEASLSWGVPWQAASDAVGCSQGQMGSSKVSDFPPQVSFQIARKTQASVLLLINVAQRNTHLLCLPGRTYLIQMLMLWRSSKVFSSCLTATSEDTGIYMGRIAA